MRHSFHPRVGSPEWQSTPVFLPGKSHGQKSLAAYSPWGRKESGMTERTPHPPAQCAYVFVCRHVRMQIIYGVNFLLNLVSLSLKKNWYSLTVDFKSPFMTIK